MELLTHEQLLAALSDSELYLMVKRSVHCTLKRQNVHMSLEEFDEHFQQAVLRYLSYAKRNTIRLSAIGLLVTLCKNFFLEELRQRNVRLRWMEKVAKIQAASRQADDPAGDLCDVELRQVVLIELAKLTPHEQLVIRMLEVHENNLAAAAACGLRPEAFGMALSRARRHLFGRLAAMGLPVESYLGPELRLAARRRAKRD